MHFQALSSRGLEKLCNAYRRTSAFKVKDDQQERLEAALHAQEHAQEQQTRLRDAKERLQRSRAQLVHINKQKSLVIDEARSIRQDIEAKRLSLQDQDVQHQAKRAKLQASEATQQQEEDGLSAFNLGLLAVETRARLGTLMEILPLSCETASQSGWRRDQSSRKLGRTVYICGCQLPMDPLGTPSEELQARFDASLGYLSLLLNLLAVYLNAPLLTHTQFGCSTSSIWLPRSFWRDSKPSKSRVLNLFLSQSQPAVSTISRPPSSSSGPSSAFSALKQRLHLDWDGKHRNHQPVASNSEVSDMRGMEDYKLAVGHLCRNIGVLAAGHPNFPTNQPPLAALSDFCWQIAMRPRTDHAGALSVLAESTIFQRPVESVYRRSVGSTDAEIEDADGWDVIQRPFQSSSMLRSQMAGSEAAQNLMMPPPPSDSDEVIKHWERANFSTPSTSEGYFGPYLKQYNRHVMPLRQTAFQAADRLFQTFRGM